MANRRVTGGEPDIAAPLVGHLTGAGFKIREAVPRVYCIGPNDKMWPWVRSLRYFPGSRNSSGAIWPRYCRQTAKL
jgi:hypothetical protein